MKKRILQCLSLLLCAALLCVPAFAEEAEEEAPARLGPVQMWGSIQWMDEDSFLLTSGQDEDNQTVIHLSQETLCLEAVDGAPLNVKDLKDGDTVYAWVGPAMALSMPPQTSAQLILGNIPADYAVPQFYQVALVKPQAMAAIYPPPPLTHVEVVATSGEELRITDKAALTPYLTKNMVYLESIVPGTRMLVWKDRSGEITKAMLFAYEYRGYVGRYDETRVTVNDVLLDQSAKITAEGERLLPIRAVAEALGMRVTWDAAKGAVVSYGDDMVRPAPLESEVLMTAMPGGAVTAVDKDGETQELYGTCVKENGVTYLSETALAQALELFLAY